MIFYYICEFEWFYIYITQYLFHCLWLSIISSFCLAIYVNVNTDLSNFYLPRSIYVQFRNLTSYNLNIYLTPFLCLSIYISIFLFFFFLSFYPQFYIFIYLHLFFIHFSCYSYNIKYTEHQKKLITSSEWHSLKSTTSKLILLDTD